MSLYGIDIIIDRKGKKYLNEINGVKSGMRGFGKIYGDNRVEEKVFSMLEEKHGKLTVNDGSFAFLKFKKKHPVLHTLLASFGMFCTALSATCESPRRIVRPRCLWEDLQGPSVVRSKKANTKWMYEPVQVRSFKVEPRPKSRYQSYFGQRSTVINLLNERLPHPTVNSYVAEEVASNKLLQYALLKDSEIKEHIPASTLVGYGFLRREEMAEILASSSEWIIKPILGACGLGVQKITREEIQKYLDSEGMLEDYGSLTQLSMFTNKRPMYLEELVDKEDFRFEPGVALIQPFIDSKKDGKYSAIRAIVCNGEFVDAYMRESECVSVNYHRGAEAKPFKEEGFSEFCENIVRVFEEECEKYSPVNYHKDIYKNYMPYLGPKIPPAITSLLAPIFAMAERSIPKY